jgi:hypothetical protein
LELLKVNDIKENVLEETSNGEQELIQEVFERFLYVETSCQDSCILSKEQVYQMLRFPTFTKSKHFSTKTEFFLLSLNQFEIVFKNLQKSDQKKVCKHVQCEIEITEYWNVRNKCHVSVEIATNHRNSEFFAGRPFFECSINNFRRK